MGHKHFCPCLLCIASRLLEKSLDILPITPFQNPCRCPRLLTPQDFQLSFYFLGKTTSISSPRKDRVCPLSRNTTSGAVLSFLLLSWCGALLPWVTMLGHDGWSWWRWLTSHGWDFAGEGKQAVHHWPLSLNSTHRQGSLETNTVKCWSDSWSCVSLCLAFLCPIGGHSINSFCWIPK